MPAGKRMHAIIGIKIKVFLHSRTDSEEMLLNIKHSCAHVESRILLGCTEEQVQLTGKVPERSFQNTI